MKHLMFVWMLLPLAILTQCQKTGEHKRNETIPLVRLAPTGEAKLLKTDSLKKRFPGATRSESGLLDTWDFEGGSLSFYISEESISELQSTVGFGSYSDWVQQLGLEKNSKEVSITHSDFSLSLLSSTRKLLLIEGYEYKLMAIFGSNGSFFGRIWDERSMTTWGFQGSYTDENAVGRILAGLVPSPEGAIHPSN